MRARATSSPVALALAALLAPVLRAAQIEPRSEVEPQTLASDPGPAARANEQRAPVLAPARDRSVEFLLVLPDGRPAAHASVRSARFRTPADLDYAWIAASVEPFAHVDTEWTELVADERGLIRLTPAAGDRWIEARWSDGSDDHVGATWVNDNLAHPGPHVLPLVVKHSLVVRVIDADGAPLAGQALELLGRFGEVQDVRVSDAAGHVRWEWTDIAAAHVPQVWPNDRTAVQATDVRPTIVTADRKPITLPLGRGVQVIQLPPSGWVTVTADIAGGLEIDVQLSASPAGGRVSDVADLRTQTRGGAARFRVGLGLALEAEIGGVRVTFAGPERRDQEVSTHWPTRVERPGLRLLLVDETGRPRAREPVRVWPPIERESVDPHGRAQITSLRGAVTNARGVLAFELPREWPSNLVLRGRSAERAHGALIEWEARVDLSATRPGQGPLDLGAIVTQELAVLAHGRVVDPHGRPFAGAEVRPRADARPPEWHSALPFDGVTTGENGAFVLFGREDNSAQWLHVSALGHNATAARRSSPGPLQLVVGPKTYVALEVNVADGLADGALALVAVDADGVEHPAHVPDARLGAPARTIGMHYAPTGRVRLVLRCRATERDLAERSLVVPADIATDAGRWDVTAAFETFELRVTDVDAEAIAWEATVERDGEPLGKSVRGAGFARLPKLLAGDVLVVTAEGRRSERVAISDGTRDVVVELRRP